MASRTQIVCLCEGEKGKSIDEVFINKLIKSLDPKWLRPGSNRIRLVPCGGRKQLIEKMPKELKNCLAAGGNTTLMVWADCDDNCDDGDALKQKFWTQAQQSGVSSDDFSRIVFIFAKYRLENWIEFLQTDKTNEAKKGPRLSHNREAADAAKKLAKLCKDVMPVDGMPPSLQWSCGNWQKLVRRMSD